MSIGISLARNTIGWEPEAVAAPALSSDDRLAGGLAVGTKVRIANGPGAGDVFEYIGPPLTPTANDPLCPGSSRRAASTCAGRTTATRSSGSASA